MKRILCLILAIASMCMLLVSCNDDILSQAEKALNDFDLELPEKEEIITVDFYIIGGDESVNAANLTVANKLNDKFKTDYNTAVDMHYVSANEYRNTVINALRTEKASGTDEKRVSVVLVNSEELYSSLKEMGVLVNIAPLIESTSYNYGTLKKQIGELFSVAMDMEKSVKDESGEESKVCYVVPNNHVYGKYTYTCINKEMAIDSNLATKAKNCKTNSDVKDLADKFKAAYAKLYPEATETEINESLDRFIQTDLEGYAGDIVEAQGEYYTVVTEEPVATKSDVLSTAFAVAGNAEYAERAMRVIYAINTDSYYRNLLQYGVEGINYSTTVVNGITVAKPAYMNNDSASGNNVSSTTYKMSLMYTGDIYKAYNCADVCIFCTDGGNCTDHVYWTSDNVATCTTWISYELNGGEWSKDFVPVTGITNTKLNLENYVPVKGSYTFAGWYTSAALSSESHVKELNYGKGSVKLYAKWVLTESSAEQ